MTAPIPQPQPVSEHTPTPWGHKLARTPTDGEYDCGISAAINGRLYCIAEAVGRCAKDIKLPAEANAAFIVEAVNSYASLKAKVEELEAALLMAVTHKSAWRQIIDDARENASDDREDMDEKGYLTHELHAFDGAFAMITAALQPKGAA